jgi:hypothetical protein
MLLLLSNAVASPVDTLIILQLVNVFLEEHAA